MILSLALPLASCGGMSDEEATLIVKDLVERSTVLNEVLYGKGMDYEKSIDGNYSGIYSRVSEDAPFQTKKDLEREIKAVFTSAYANSLISTAFKLTQGALGSNSYPRYQEGSDKVLTVMRDYTAREITEYDFDTIEIKKVRKNKIRATILSTENEIVEIYIVKELDGWRLDSVTA